MRKAEKSQEIIGILDEHFPNPGIPLNHNSPYTLLIAVLLSAQCTDDRVNKVTPALFALADTPKKMANNKSNVFKTSFVRVDSHHRNQRQFIPYHKF
jgi:endonuclease III